MTKTRTPVTPPDQETAGEYRLTLLVAEDEPMSREMLLMELQGLFARIEAAADGSEAFELFLDRRPDIVLTDQFMPGLSGLDLIRRIRADGADTPVVLMTAAIDNQLLQDAINSGVDRFVPKPFDFGLLKRVLSGMVRDITAARQLADRRRQEVELLRCRDEYHAMQQEAALRKERHVVRHDLRNRILDGREGSRWGINAAYSPHDIMCGDGYSVRRLFDGRQLIFIVDAMGSGMSASLTALLATAFFNYQVEYLHLWSRCSLTLFIQRFQEYLAGMLLEDEVISCGFLLVDLAREEVETALFALPPLLVRDLDGTVRRIRSQNPPLGVFPADCATGSLSLAGVADMLLITDGVSDALLLAGGSYREEIERDFGVSPTLAALYRLFRRKTDQTSLDDLTLIHLRRLDLPPCWRREQCLPAHPAGILAAVADLADALERTVCLTPEVRGELEDLLIETLGSAAENGGTGTGQGEPEGPEEAAGRGAAALRPDATISLSATLWRQAGTPLLRLEILRDSPDLPDGTPDPVTAGASESSRTISVTHRFCDSFFMDHTGNRLIILKTLEGELTHAH
jgi:CheY-like chemotaxis protein